MTVPRRLPGGTGSSTVIPSLAPSPLRVRRPWRPAPWGARRGVEGEGRREQSKATPAPAAAPQAQVQVGIPGAFSPAGIHGSETRPFANPRVILKGWSPSHDRRAHRVLRRLTLHRAGRRSGGRAVEVVRDTTCVGGGRPVGRRALRGLGRRAAGFLQGRPRPACPARRGARSGASGTWERIVGCRRRKAGYFPGPAPPGDSTWGTT